LLVDGARRLHGGGDQPTDRPFVDGLIRVFANGSATENRVLEFHRPLPAGYSPAQSLSHVLTGISLRPINRVACERR
jgi:hypothetical protein